MRVDESIIFQARRRSQQAARQAAEDFIESYPSPLKIVRIEGENHVDQYGARNWKVTIVPDWQ